ncbi:MAG: cobaltochelatase subunit CobN [Elusimicrobiota bacterium]
MTQNLSFTGFYHPDSKVIHEDIAGYMDWYEKNKLKGPGNKNRHKAGIFFSRQQVLKNNLCGIDALIYELEKHNIIPVPVFSQQKEHSGIDCPGYNVDLNQLKNTDVIINCVSSFLFQTEMTADDNRTVLDLIDAPIFQAIYSSGRSEAEWRSSPQGITAMNQIYRIAQPEFNGTIEPTVIFARDCESKGEYGSSVPVKERIEFLVRRIKNWLRLKELPKNKRRVTILLHNNPCAGTEASLGGANGLDSFESVVKLMKYLAGEGYHIENMPENGKALTDEFLNKKAVSEFRWTTVEEIVDKGGVAVFIEPDKYAQYFNQLSEVNRKKMLENWGEPPGKSMVYGDKIVVTGLTFGNIKVIAEPKRGCYGARCDGEVCKILHNPEIPPTHQCYAGFKWIQENSDIIISTGTHGYIEFLPGKASGLSSDCFPEIITGDIPHIYIYTSKNPNEAIIAKRRAYAVVTDHIIPYMQSAKLYDELCEIDDLLSQYSNASLLNEDGRKKMLFEDIRNLAVKLKLFHSCEKHPVEEMKEDEMIQKVHDKLFLLRDSNINDGLHILSKTNDIEKTTKMILAILKYDGSVPSIRRCILEIMGYNYDEINKNSQDTQLLDECEKTAFSLVENVLNNNRVDEDFVALQFKGVQVRATKVAPTRRGRLAFPAIIQVPIQKFNRTKTNKLLYLLTWVKDELYPALMKTEQEIPQINKALDKRYISPGPGGTLTRGKTDVLPTGRNIYSMDPRKIPTKAAYKIGVRLADEIVKKYMAEENKYPEKIGMVLWSLDAYRADGEQLAQILHLMGARPVWNESGIVTGVEPLLLQELNRPRIDVTIRTSEIFRDTLPNLIELLDSAVVLISNLKEDETQNYILKNVNEYKRTARENNSKLDDAALSRTATFRIFAAKPGAYGNGIKLMLAASAWKTIKDLGETFIEHGGFAYGREVFGRESYGEFVHNLKTITTVFHKVETDETDLLGCCYNDFQGGMTAAVRALSNSTPKVLWGDTKDPANPKVRELSEEIERVVRVKLLNPQWIEGMKKHGYKGAQDMAHKAAAVYGWDATSDVVDDWIFDELTKKHVLDKDMREFYEKNNPWALEELARRFLEAEQRGLWKADPQVLKDLKDIYLEIEGWMEEKMGDVKGEYQGGNVDIMTKTDVKEWAGRLHFNIDDYLPTGGKK